MWVLKKINQNQDFASGKFSSQSQLAEFMGIHPRTLNKALKEDRNSFQFRGELVSVHQLPEFSAEDSSGNHQFFEKEAQIVEFFSVSRQTVYLAFKNANEKVFKKAGVKWTVKRLLQDEVPICKDQRSQSFKVTKSNSTLTLTPSVPEGRFAPDQRSHTTKPKSSIATRKKIPRRSPKNEEDEWLRQIQEEAEEESRICNERCSRFLQSQRPWILLPPTFPFGAGGRIALFNPDTNISKIVNGYRDVKYYFKDEGLNFYLSEEEFYELRPVLDFAVDSPDDMNPQFWIRYLFIWPTPDLPWSEAEQRRAQRKVLKPPSKSVSKIFIEED